MAGQTGSHVSNLVILIVLQYCCIRLVGSKKNSDTDSDQGETNLQTAFLVVYVYYPAYYSGKKQGIFYFRVNPVKKKQHMLVRYWVV